MKKKLTITCLFIFLFQYGFAQMPSKKVDIRWSDEQNVKNGYGGMIGEIMGFDDTNIYAFKAIPVEDLGFNVGIVILERYNKNLELLESAKFELEMEGKDRELNSVFYLNDKIYVFTSYKNKKQRKYFLFVESVDKNTLKRNDDFKKVGEISYDKTSGDNVGNFNFKVSRDKSRLLVYYNLPYRKRQNEKYGFHVFDDDMNQVWEKEVTLPYTDELFEVKDYEISNTGDVYLLGRAFTKNPERTRIVQSRNSEPEYTFTILGYLGNGEREKQYALKNDDHFLTEMDIVIGPDQNIICAGFYSDESKNGAKGSYFLKVDGESQEVIEKTYNEFSFEFITQNLSENKGKKAKRKKDKDKNVELNKYTLDRIILREDGGAVLIGEQSRAIAFQKGRYNASNQFQSTGGFKYTYYHNDIVVINLAPDGTQDWTEKIGKRQIGRETDKVFLGYSVTVVGDRLYFIFNDETENLFYKGQGELAVFNTAKRKKGGVVNLVEIDAEGNQTREMLYNIDVERVAALPSLCVQISDNEMLFKGVRQLTSRSAKIRFKD